MLNLLAESLVIVGAFTLIGALIPVRRLIGQLPAGPGRNRWYVLAALIVAVIMGYTGYAIAFASRHAAWLDLMVPAVFFCGAAYVWLTVTLARQTALADHILFHSARKTDDALVLTARYLGPGNE